MSSPHTPEMIRELRTVAEPSLSPDGSKLAYTLGWVDQDLMESRSRIMVADLVGGEEGEFTQGSKDTSAKFSPDARLLAFLRPGPGPINNPANSSQPTGESRAAPLASKQRGQQGQQVQPKQLWVIPTGGGESRPLNSITAVSGDIVDYAWSPDGRTIVFSADVPAATGGSNGEPEAEPRVPEPHVSVVRHLHYRHDTLGWRGDSHFHLFLADVTSGETTQLTDGDWDDTAPVWSPDGAKIAFVSGRKEDRDIRAGTEAYVISLSDGKPHLWSDGLAGVGALAWSPHSDVLVAVASESPGYMVVWQGWLYLLEPGSHPQRLTDDTFRPCLGFPHWSRSPEIRWTQDGRILFLGDCRGESYLYQVSAATGKATTLLGGGCQSTDLSLDAGAEIAAVLSSSPGAPAELRCYRLAPNAQPPSQAPGQPAQHNREYLQQHPPASMERLTVRRGDHLLDCRLFLPPDFDPALRYPMVLDIHGGPNGAFYDSFLSWQQLLATNGYLLLAVNPRGSSTYGEDFMMAVLDDWGGEDYLDLMEAVDRLAERPYVDETRLGVHGYSYGGYMASWIVGQTNRFRAAVVGAPCIDLFSMYGTSDIGVTFGEAQWNSDLSLLNGQPLDQLALQLLRRSPITYAPAVETPVLLLHGEADLRCPIGQSEAYFTVLKRLGKIVEMVRFPDCSHLFLRQGHPRLREEYLARTLSWFQRYL